MNLKKITNLNLLIICFLCFGLKANAMMHPPPTPDFMALGLCAGDTTYFFDHTTSGYAIQWSILNDKGDTLYSSGNKDISYYFKKAGVYTVNMTAYNGHLAYLTKNILIDTVPHADFSFEHCFNQFYNLSSCSDQFTWIFPDSSISTDNFPSYKFKKAGTYSVTLIAKGGSKADTVVKQIKITADSLGFPDATFTSFLKDTNLLIFDFTVIDTGETHYYWDFGDGYSDNVSGYKVTHQLDTSTYNPPVFIFVTNGCGSARYELDPLSMLCLYPTHDTVTNITSDAAVLNWKGIGLYYEIEWGVQGFTLGSGTSTTTFNTTYVLTGLQPNTTYSYYIRADCDTTITQYVGPYTFTTLSVGIKESSFINPVTISPNPSHGQFTFNNLENKNTIEIYDVTGRNIYRTISKNNSCIIDLTEKDKGVYFYKIVNEKMGMQQGKIVIQ